MSIGRHGSENGDGNGRKEDDGCPEEQGKESDDGYKRARRYRAKESWMFCQAEAADEWMKRYQLLVTNRKERGAANAGISSCEASGPCCFQP